MSSVRVVRVFFHRVCTHETRVLELEASVICRVGSQAAAVDEHRSQQQGEELGAGRPDRREQSHAREERAVDEQYASGQVPGRGHERQREEKGGWRESSQKPARPGE